MTVRTGAHEADSPGYALVERRLLEAIDDDDLDRPASALKLQPKLLLHCGENVRRIRIHRGDRVVRVPAPASTSACSRSSRSARSGQSPACPPAGSGLG